MIASRSFRRAGLLLLLGAAPLAAQAKTGSPLVAEIPSDQLSAVARTVKAVRVEPATLTLRVGETISLGKLTVTVIDSSGKVRGRLGSFDFVGAPNGPFQAVPRQVTGVRPGTADLTIRYPRQSWKERTDPRAEAKVKIVVIP